MRRLGLRGVVTATLAALVIPLACAGGAAAASTTVWPAAAALALPSDASGTQSATSLPSVSCGSSAQCVAVGAYSGASATEPMVATATNGSWTGAAAIAPPSGASSASLASVSCSAAGSCVAVGSDDSSGTTHPMFATDSNSTWSGASEISGATGGSLSGVSCASGSCSAVGANAGQPLTMNGSAGGLRPVTAPALPSGGTSGALTAVACASPGNCGAVGHYVDAGGQTQAMVATETAGTWGAAAEVALPTGAAATQNASLNAVACSAAGQCRAVGSYTNGTGQTAAMVVSENNNTWTQGVALGLPTGATGSTLDSISCTSANACTATGSVLAGTAAPLSATDSGGIWGTGTALTTPPGAVSSTSLSSIALAVGCTGAGKCDAAGTYPVAAGAGAMTIASHPSLVITSHTLRAGAVGSHYSVKIATSGGTGGNVWTLTGGSLPAGLTLSSTGVVSGTPTIDQTTTFTVSVHDSASPADQASGTISIRIGPATKPPKSTTGKQGKSSGKGSRHKHSKKQKGAKVGAVKVVHGTSVRLSVKCLIQRRCDGRVAVVVVEHLRGKRVIAINATTRRTRGTRTKTVWLGSVRYALRAGHKVTRTIRLNRTGTRLLRARHTLKAGVALRPASFKRATIMHTVKLHEPKAKKHKTHAKDRKKKGSHSA